MVRNFPAEHRVDKTSLRDQLQVEHDVLPATGAVTGRHKFPSGNTAGRPADPVTGSIYFNTQTGGVEQFDGAVWQQRTAAFPATTTLLFKQAAAPTGWTRVVDAGNTDATIILRLNGEVPGVGGSWTISGGSVSSHVLTIAEMPSHTHNIPMQSVGEGAGATAHVANTTDLADIVSRATGGGGGHVHPFTHDGAWRPKRVDVIVCSKD